MSERSFMNDERWEGFQEGHRLRSGGAQLVDERVDGLEGDVGLLAQVHPLFVTVGE